MHNLRSNSAKISAGALAALIALLLALYIPSILHNINPCLTSKSCLTPYQLDVLFQEVTNATNGNIANTLAVVQEIQASVPACPEGNPKRYQIEHPWVSDPSFLTLSVNCAHCWCRGGCCLKASTCMPCCASNTTR